jgi:uncharacterized protein
MSHLPVLLELQAIHDNLSTIQRDLTAFPPEMAKLDADLKVHSRKLEIMGKELTDAKTSQTSLSRELGLAQRLEDLARQALKQSTQKIQYTAAIRELDERERQKAAISKPLKDLEGRIQVLEKELSELTELKDKAQTEFDELHRIFLSEHENQIQARDSSLNRKHELEAKLEPIELGRFNRLIQGRHGRAVVAVENGTCTGCRTKLRGPFLAQLREKKTLNCESCQRILYVPTTS